MGIFFLFGWIFCWIFEILRFKKKNLFGIFWGILEFFKEVTNVTTHTFRPFLVFSSTLSNTEVTTEHQKWPEIGKNRVQTPFF